MRIFVIIILILSIYSCRSKRVIYLNNIRHAAQINIPADLDTLVIVDRTRLAKNSGKKVLNVLEGIVSGEPIMGDKYGTQNCLSNLERLLIQSDRITLGTPQIIKLFKYDMKSSTPINGDVLDSICNRYQADGVISLEMFDSDEFGSRSSNVKTFWRLYYADKHEITDEFTIFSNGYANYNYYSVVPTQYRSISYAGAYGAQLYFDRIVPYYAREYRYYYPRGSTEFKMGRRAMIANDWDQAIYFWQSYVDNNANMNMRKSGRAAFNIALAYEAKMDFDNALKWIDKAIMFGNKQAVTYRGTLIYRRNEQPLIQQQLKRE